jgi:HAD superfamily hydrolase (TIGR01484 family)
MQNIEIIVFDLDGTLTESKSVLLPEMADVLCKLLAVKKVAIISGASYKQFQKQFLTQLTCPPELLGSLYILPTNGTQLYMYDIETHEIKEMYEDDLTEAEKQKIISAFEETFKQVGFVPENVHGVLIEDRQSQITFSALGSEAPLELKQNWDPDWGKRKAMRRILLTLIPEFEVRLGGMTSIDVTKKGFDKAYGLNRLAGYLKIDVQSILYVGDALFAGGNDSSVLTLDIQTRSTRGPAQTKEIIETFL